MKPFATPTTAEAAKNYGANSTMIGTSKKSAIASMAFAVKAAQKRPISQKDVVNPHAKSGQPVVERDFLSETSSLVHGTGGAKR